MLRADVFRCVLTMSQSDGVVVTRSFSESFHPVSAPKSGNDGDFIFAQTAYKFDVGFVFCPDV